MQAAEPLAFGPVRPPADLLSEIGGIRKAVAEAGHRPDAVAGPTRG